MFRRSYMEKVYQNIFVTQRLIPKPFSESTYYFKPLNYEDCKNLIKNGYSFNDLNIKQFKNIEKQPINFGPWKKKMLKMK